MLLRNTGIQQMFEKCLHITRLLQDIFVRYSTFRYFPFRSKVMGETISDWTTTAPFHPIPNILPPPRTHFRINSQFVDHDFNSLIMLDPSLISTESLCNPQSVTNSFEAKESRNDVILFFLSPILFQKIIQWESW